jgi:hypothetical protein
MGQINAKLHRTDSGYAHWCPGCEGFHNINVDVPRKNGARWSFNGNVAQPSFSPSVNITYGPTEPEFQGDWAPLKFGPDNVARCHYFLTDGHLRFCGDSTHALSGQSVPLPDLPQG